MQRDFPPTYHTGVRILRAIAERAGQRGAAALVVVRILPIVDRTVDRNGPHGGGIPVTVAIVLLAPVTGRPHVDVAQPVPALVDALHDRAHRRVPGAVHRFAVVGRAPGRAVDVDLVRLVPHRVRLDQIGHVRLVQHPDAGDLRIIRHAHPADAVVPGGGYLTGAPCAMAEKKGGGRKQ